MKYWLNRRWNQLRAFFTGYFWCRCPICGEMFGGHEPHGSWSTSWGGGELVCINCKPEAERRTASLYDDYQKNYHMNMNTGQLERNDTITVSWFKPAGPGSNWKGEN